MTERAHAGTAGTLIRPPKRWPGLAFAELLQQRAICLVLTRRNLMVRYRQTVIGASWSVLQPLLLMLVFTVFFGLVVQLPADGLPYPLFLFLGLLPWQMVAKITSEGSTSVVNNATLVTRVYFPRAYFPISVALASLVDLALSSIALAALLIFFGVTPGVQLLATPIFVALAWFTGLGVSLFLSSINVAYRDVTQLLPFFVQLWMFSSPIIYPSSVIPEPYRAFYFLNPMVLVIDGFRWAIAGAVAPSLAEWIIGSSAAAVIVAVGYAFFRLREPSFADVI